MQAAFFNTIVQLTIDLVCIHFHKYIFIMRHMNVSVFVYRVITMPNRQKWGSWLYHYIILAIYHIYFPVDLYFSQINITSKASFVVG